MVPVLYQHSNHCLAQNTEFPLFIPTLWHEIGFGSICPSQPVDSKRELFQKFVLQTRVGEIFLK
jgi:hypothetical protein